MSKLKKTKGNTMKTLITSILMVVGLIMMAGAAGDCDGKCVENANTVWETFVYALMGLTMFLTGGIIAITNNQ